MTVALLAQERQDRRRIVWLLIALVAVIGVAAWWGLPHIEASRTDATLDRLAAEEWETIEVSFSGRDAQLTGLAPLGVDPEDVATLVSGIWGVRRVETSIQPSGSSAAVDNSLEDPAGTLSPSTVSIVAAPSDDDPTRDVVRLSGVVPSSINVDNANAAAAEAFGASNVDNDLEVDVVEDPAWLPRIWDVLSVLPGVGRVEINVDNDRVVVLGTVGDAAASANIESILSASVGSDLLVDNQLTVEALFDPLVSFDVSEDTVTLEGRLPQARIVEAIGAAEAAFGAAAISNEMLAGSVRDAEWLDGIWPLLDSLVGAGEVRLRVDGAEALLEGAVNRTELIDTLEASVRDAVEPFGMDVINTLRFDVVVAAAACPAEELNALVDVGVLFETESDALTADGLEDLDAVVALLLVCEDVPVEVAGHTDSTGDDAFNLGLSERRATSVVEYLVDQGVPEDRLEAVGYGETQPIADNDTAEGRAENRRIEFIVGGNT